MDHLTLSLNFWGEFSDTLEAMEQGKSYRLVQRGAAEVFPVFVFGQSDYPVAICCDESFKTLSSCEL